MKTFKGFVIFVLNLNPDDDEPAKYKKPEDLVFPMDWKTLGKDGSPKVFEAERNALEYLKLHTNPNRIYRICSWEIVADHRVFSNKTQLVEVEEI